MVAYVVRLVAVVVGDGKGQISRNKVDGHVQNWSSHHTIGGTTDRLLTDIIKCGYVSVAEFHDGLVVRSLLIARPLLESKHC